MKKVITYGTYDLLHRGHINLLRRAKELGDYLIVGVTTDSFDLERGKLNVCNNVMERIKAVEATGLADQIVIEEYVGQKIDDIKRYGVDVFAIGSDWEGKFDYLKEFCEVVYLPRTEGISSTLLRDTEMNIRIGIVGTGSIADRFAKEARYVSRAELTAVYNPDIRQAERFAQENAIAAVAPTFEELSASVDAIYVASPHLTHYDYTRRALLAGKHVLCEPPFVLSKKEAVELYALAEERRLILMVALKTAYFPAFDHLITLLKSGTIGEIVEISSSVTTLVDESSSKLNPDAAGGSMNENACFPLLPIFKLLGTAYKDIRFISRFRNGADIYTKCVMAYENGVGSFQVGLGVKSE
ncbi:MAG: Gfo/Idh/MocA family oxidoreductase, partial [Alistipes sp.]|nr:Gfo/Idh/MocA family oxidoreductase [Alistipes sp.]